jgi:hypothetical protein
MEPEGSSQCSQKPATGPYPEPAESSSPFKTFFCSLLHASYVNNRVLRNPYQFIIKVEQGKEQRML